MRIDGSYGRPSPYKLVRYLADGTTIVATSAQLWKADAAGALRFYAGNEGDAVGEIAGTTATSRFVNPRSLSADTAGNLYVLDDVDATLATAYKIAPDGTVTPILRRSDFNQPSRIIVAPDGAIYLTKKARPFPYPDHWQYRGDTIYKLEAAGVPQLLAGSGLALLAGTPRVDGNRVGDLLGSLKATPAGSGAPASLAIAPTGPGSFALISGGAILRLVVPH